ncbi:hypothetical protein OsJ_03747 [Oryza sativa Japonica Group]|uniref:Uncharacterized protein n=1 Tax=Oryza sativa subsp. japonica TaxID=39947 RepID=A2ZYM7_ORYSJ|nr:hypothetical protein OsJ_03747 [Oryza sativa Japonica Group]
MVAKLGKLLGGRMGTMPKNGSSIMAARAVALLVNRSVLAMEQLAAGCREDMVAKLGKLLGGRMGTMPKNGSSIMAARAVALLVNRSVLAMEQLAAGS